MTNNERLKKFNLKVSKDEIQPEIKPIDITEVKPQINKDKKNKKSFDEAINELL